VNVKGLVTSVLSLPLISMAGPKPNILLIFTDDLNYDGISVQGGKYGRTPNIDSIAHNGVLFTDAYVTASTCCPSRAGLLTGRYQQRFGHENNGSMKLENEGLPVSEKTFGNDLQALGYKTAVIGKWHMGHGVKFPKYHAQNRGFDRFWGFMGSMIWYTRSDALWDGFEPDRNPDYTTDLITDKTIDFIESAGDQPWMVYAAYNYIHTPIEPKEGSLDDFSWVPDTVMRGKPESEQRQAKYAMTRTMDDAVGRLLDKLQALGQLENTLVIFSNDNGDYAPNGNGAFSGGKGQVREGGIRVPMLMQWPAKIPAGQIIHEPVSTLDFTPTMIAAAGGEPTRELDGINLLPAMTGKEALNSDRPLYWRAQKARAIRVGEWKAVYSGPSGYGDRDFDAPDERWYLFNLAESVSEDWKNDLSVKYPGKLNELVALWDAWNEHNIEPLWPSGGSGEMGRLGDAE
jgi:arylsulfatase A-like enzyme